MSGRRSGRPTGPKPARVKKRDNLRQPRLCETTGKHQYRSVMAAERFAGLATEARGTQLRIYRCQFCDLYHLTSKPRTTSREKFDQKMANDPRICEHGVLLAAWCIECAKEPIIYHPHSDADDRIVELDDEEYDRG